MSTSGWFHRGLVVAIGMALVSIALAQDAKPAGKAEAKDKKPASEITQKTCPVMVGKKINPKLFVEHDGLKVYLCCNDCVEKFKKDPKKYIAEVYRQIYPQQIQLKCPVTGEDIDPKVSAEVGGRTVYFCCKDCIAKFNADPSKYAAALKPEAGLLARGKDVKDDLFQCAVCSASMGAAKRSAGKTTDYKGTTYFLCSDGCVDSFKGDSEKYVKKLAETMKALSSAKRPG